MTISNTPVHCDPFEVLLIEDNDGDILLIQEALEQTDFPIHLTIVNNGKDALDYLRHEGCFTTTHVPALVVLDINLPLHNGFEVLEALRKNPETEAVPVHFFTTSSAATDMDRAYQLKTDGFSTKPADLDDFYNEVRSIVSSWAKQR